MTPTNRPPNKRGRCFQDYNKLFTVQFRARLKVKLLRMKNHDTPLKILITLIVDGKMVEAQLARDLEQVESALCNISTPAF